MTETEVELEKAKKNYEGLKEEEQKLDELEAVEKDEYGATAVRKGWQEMNDLK